MQAANNKILALHCSIISAKSEKNWTSSTETTEKMKFNGKLMIQTVTIRNKHLKRIFYRHNLPETAVTSVTNETGLKKWTSSTETTETMKMNRKLMKRTVTRSNKHLGAVPPYCCSFFDLVYCYTVTV